ncbi:MAG TPA: hypothetical protein VIV12_31385, partial [Streptosporangiaceae bacterium]
MASGVPLPHLAPGDLVAVLDAGAYVMVMASSYNGQPRPAEVVVTGGEALISRRREAWEELLAWESGRPAGWRSGFRWRPRLAAHSTPDPRVVGREMGTGASRDHPAPRLPGPFPHLRAPWADRTAPLIAASQPSQSHGHD